MSTEGHSTYSYEKSTAPLICGTPTKGTHKVKYQAEAEWDFQLDTVDHTVDLNLNLPHYRARYQPVDHRMSVFICGDSEPIKLKLCRTNPRTKFYLEIQSGASDVTVWLPSDFKGQIHYGGKASFSAGFVNRILRNVRFNETQENVADDEVVVVTKGQVTFRMWDIETCAPENCTKEQLKRFFGCSRRTQTSQIDWDCLVRD